MLGRSRRRPQPRAGGHLRAHPYDPPSSASGPRPYRWNWGGLLRPLDERLRKASDTPLSPRSILQLRYYWIDGLFASFSENLWITFVPLFALACNATSGQIGLLSSAASVVGAVALFPGARLVERTARPRQLVVASGGVVARLPMALAAVLPFVIAAPGALVFCIIALYAIRTFGNMFANPAWHAMSAELVPPRLRGRYFAAKNIAMGIAAFAAGPLGGLLIRSASRIGGVGGQLGGYQLVFLLAFASGMVATLAFWRIPDAPFHPPERTGLLALVRAVTEVRLFPVFLASGFVWNLAVQTAVPFFTVYMVQRMGASVTDVGLATGCAALAALAGQYVFGRAVDRKGSISVQVLTSLAIAAVPLPWIWSGRPWQAAALMGAAGFFWAGYNLANFNLLLELTPDRLRARATAVYVTVVMAGNMIGPLIGGAIVESAGFRPVFVLTSVGRMAGALIFGVGVWISYRAARAAERQRPGKASSPGPTS